MAKAATNGICSFCQGEFSRSRMTQHLKHCKERTTQLQAQLQQEAPEGMQKGKWLHLFVEGRYNSEYWMHLEIPAVVSLYELDRYLRDVWLECCSHLSAFRIGKISYESAMEDEFGDGAIVTQGTREQEIESFKLITEEVLKSYEEVGKGPELSANKRKKLVEVIYNWAFGDEKQMPPELTSILENYPLLEFSISSLKRQSVLMELSMYEAIVGEALQVGQKFSYTYDFGSSTDLTFKVVAEREGLVPVLPQIEFEEIDNSADLLSRFQLVGGDTLEELQKAEDAQQSDLGEEEDEEMEEEQDDDIVHMLARNVPPSISCDRCGKPADYLVTFFDMWKDNNALCKQCVEEISKARPAHAAYDKDDEDEYEDEEFYTGEEEYEGLAPIVNSPRVGVCAYGWS